MLQSQCFKCSSPVIAWTLLAVYLCVVVVCLGYVTACQVEMSGVSISRYAWVTKHGNTVNAIVTVAVDVLQLFALQILLPSELSKDHVQASMAIAGPSLSAVMWPPLACIFHGINAQLSSVYTLLPIAALAGLLSHSMAAGVWGRKGSFGLPVWRQRTVVALRRLLWFAYPGVLWMSVHHSTDSHQPQLTHLCTAAVLGCVSKYCILPILMSNRL